MKLLMENWRQYVKDAQNFDLLEGKFSNKEISEQNYVSEWISLFNEEVDSASMSLDEGVAGDMINNAISKMSVKLINFISGLGQSAIKYSKKISSAYKKMRGLMAKFKDKYPKLYGLGKVVLLFIVALAFSAAAQASGYSDTATGVDFTPDQLLSFADMAKQMASDLGGSDASTLEAISNTVEAIANNGREVITTDDLRAAMDGAGAEATITFSDTIQFMRNIAQTVADAGADSVSDAITQAIPDISNVTNTRVVNIPMMATQNALQALQAMAQGNDASEPLQWLVQNKDEIEWLKDISADQILDIDLSTLQTMIRGATAN
tara:strand:- start:12 stop:974 length:963 start_codon:yes stop_codon:yes gene_type:complete